MQCVASDVPTPKMAAMTAVEILQTSTPEAYVELNRNLTVKSKLNKKKHTKTNTRFPK